jgi:hypothetical protein
VPSKIGIHGIRPNKIGDLVQRVLDGGAHIATVKAVDDLGWLPLIKQMSPQTVTVGRVTLEEGIHLGDDLREESRKTFDKVVHQWEANRQGIDYWEIINELDPIGVDGHRKLAEAMIHCMDFAEAEGFKLALFSYSMGVPEWDEIEAIVETGVFARAKEGGHILALHEYGNPMDQWFGEPIPPRPAHPERGALACRYRWWYDEFLVPRDEVVPLVITEAGTTFGFEQPEFSKEQWLEQIAWYDERLREDAYVIGCHIFTLGPVHPWFNFDFEPVINEIADHIIALKDDPDPIREVEGSSEEENGEEEGNGEIMEKVEPREPYERHYLLLPPGATWEWVKACRSYWEIFRVTVGGSADDAGWGPGLDARVVTAVNPSRWPGDLQSFFSEHYPGVVYDPIEVDNPQQLKVLLDQRVEDNKRLG